MSCLVSSGLRSLVRKECNLCGRCQATGSLPRSPWGNNPPTANMVKARTRMTMWLMLLVLMMLVIMLVTMLVTMTMGWTCCQPRLRLLSCFNPPSSPRLPHLPNLFAPQIFSPANDLIYHCFYLCVIVTWRFQCISVEIFKPGIFPNNPFSVSRSQGLKVDATSSTIEILLPSYRGFSNTFKRSSHFSNSNHHCRSVQFPWQPTCTATSSQSSEMW